MERYATNLEARGRRQARLSFTVEVLRGMPGFMRNYFYWKAAMFRNYAVISFRNMARSRIFSVVNLLGLSVGMACFILISLWIRDELGFDRFHAKKDRLFLVTIIHPSGLRDSNSPYAVAPILARESPEVESQTRIWRYSQSATCSFRYSPPDRAPVQFYENKVVFVDHAFFAMFSFPFVFGGPETSLPDPSSLVLSEKAAARYFGSQNPLGKTLTLNNRNDFKVSGVVRIPRQSDIDFDFAALIPPEMTDDWDWADPSYVFLRENVDLTSLQPKLAGLMNLHYPQSAPPLPGKFRVELLPIVRVHLTFGRMIYVSMFSAVAALILLIACINYMNLATARSSSRGREVGLRKVVGAGRSQLIQQFLGESLLMAGLALVLCAGLVKAILPAMNSLTLKELTFNPLQNPGLAAFCVGLALLTGILAGIYPAFYLSSVNPVSAFQSVRRSGSERSAFRLISVVGQFTVSTFLIICTAGVIGQLNYMRNRPLGLHPEHVVKVALNESLARQYSAFKSELLQSPGILQVTAGQAVPYDCDYKTGGLVWEGKDPSFSDLFRYAIVHYGFIETFGLEMSAGRSFSEDRPGDAKNYIVNEEAVRYMGLSDPVGKRLKLWGLEGEIIGVVRNYHHVSLHREIMPQVLTVNPRLHRALKYIFIKIRPERIPDTLGALQAAAAKFAPGFPLEYAFLDEDLGNLYATENRLGYIFKSFTFLAGFISCLGIFGLTAFAAERRTREIGIRKVLGASVSSITVLLSREFSKWLLLANLIAWPVGAYAVSRWLEKFAYRSGLTPGIFLIAGLLSFLVAALPVGYEVFKAAAGRPVESLRYE